MLVNKIVLLLQDTLVVRQCLEDHPGNRLLASAAGLYDRFFHIVRIFFDALKAVGYSQQRFIRVRTDLKYQADKGAAVPAFTFHLHQTVHIFELFFLRLDNLTLNFHRAGSTPGRQDGNLLKINIGGQLDGNSKKRNKAEQNQQ